MKRSVLRRVLIAAVAPWLALAAPARGDWASWRGPEENGVSRETGLPEKWSPAGESLLWKAPYGSRSTPIVLKGRVFLVNRADAGRTEQERIMAFDGESGRLLWERRFHLFLTDIPSNRVGWASPVGDPETGHVYVHGVQGTFLCLDQEGKLVWERSLHEEYGTITGYGGRIHNPVVVEDLVVVSFLNSSWGSQGRGGQRYVAFDKRTGAVAWWSEPGKAPLDTIYANPVVAVINGARLLVNGGADGAVHAIKASTGEKVWSFQLSQRGINSSVVSWKGLVFACHSEENPDSTTMGRLVAIDATGQGDVTKTHEKWRIDGLGAGYSSPAIHDGKLYVCDNSANLFCIDAESGKQLWRHSVGTVMKASPVVADGKIYLGEVNARWLILKPGETGCETLSEVTFPTADGSVVEVNGSAAVADGKVYLTTRDELFCIGKKPWTGKKGVAPPSPATVPPPPGEKSTFLQLTPADVVLAPGQSVALKASLYDAKGRWLRSCQPSWAVKLFKGVVSGDGMLTVAQEAGFAAGTVEARFEDLVGEARVRVVPPLPLAIDFESLEVGKPPPGWIGAGGKFAVAALDGQKVLKKDAANMRFVEAEAFFGLPAWHGYTLVADVRGGEARRNLPNIELYNSGYSLILMGNTQRLRIAAWIPMPRLDATIPFAWKANVWYRTKFKIDVAAGRGLARGKVWPRDESEPEAWSVTLEDPIPQLNGSPGLRAYSAGTTPRSPGADVFLDNIQVMRNET